MGAGADGSDVVLLEHWAWLLHSRHGLRDECFLHVNGNYLVYTNIMPDGVVLDLERFKADGSRHEHECKILNQPNLFHRYLHYL
jgi:hypothetical protein